jgi:translation elongation factor EF-Tu-like GTPase
MPFFENFLAGASEVLSYLAKKFDGKRWLEILYDGIDEEGKSQIKKLISKLFNSDQEKSTSFEIPLPIDPKNKPAKAVVESVLALGGTKYIICRVHEGTLKLGDKLTLKNHLGQVANTKCINLKLNGRNLKELNVGNCGVIFLEGVDPNTVTVGDVISSAS